MKESLNNSSCFFFVVAFPASQYNRNGFPHKGERRHIDRVSSSNHIDKIKLNIKRLI